MKRLADGQELVVCIPFVVTLVLVEIPFEIVLVYDERSTRTAANIVQ